MFNARSILAALLFTTMFVAPLRADAPPEELLGFKWCFERKQPFYQEVSIETHQRFVVGRAVMQQDQSQTFYYSWRRQPQPSAEKKIVVVQKIEGLKVDVVSGANRMYFDSTPKKPIRRGAVPAALPAIVGAEFTVTLGPDGRIVSVKGQKEMFLKLAAAHPEAETLLGAMLSDDAVRSMADVALPVIPKWPADKKKPWGRQSEYDMGAFGGYLIKDRYYFAATDGSNEKIRIERSLTYRAPRAGGGPRLLAYEIKKADIKGEASEGFLLYDSKTGRIDHYETTMGVKGNLTALMGTNEVPIALEQTHKTVVKTMAENPLEKK